MAEEFALQKSHRNCGAVQLYEGSISAFTASMNGARDDFLARSCFALDENCGVRRRHRANQVQRFHQSRAAPDDSFKCLLLGEVFVGKAHAYKALCVRKSNTWASHTSSSYAIATFCPHDIHAISEPLFVLELEYGTNSAIRTTLDGVPARRPHGDEFRHYFRGGGGQLSRNQISRLFLPKRRASIDSAPGPRIARAIPNVANKIVPRGWSVPAMAIQVSHSAIMAPAIGVHKPTSRKTPAMAAITWSAIDSRCGTPISAATPS